MSYDRKHNERNGDHNRDGTDDNRSWNCGVEGPTDDPAVEKLLMHLIANAYWEPLDFELPPVHNGDPNAWHRWIDTAMDSPDDIVEWRSSPPVPGYHYRAEARSVVVLFANMGEDSFGLLITY